MLRQVVCPYVRATPSLQGTQLYLLAKVIIFHQFSTFLCLLFEGQHKYTLFRGNQRIFSAFLLVFNLLKHHKDPILYLPLSFLRYYQHMAFVAQCGGEDIGFATILQLQSLAQFGYGEGEVAGGNVRLGNA